MNFLLCCLCNPRAELIKFKQEIDEVKKKAPSKNFWNDWYNQMALKTIVRRASKLVTLDPKKFDEYYYLMEKFNRSAEERELAEDLRLHANRETINVTPMEQEPEPAAIPERTQPVKTKVEMPSPAQTEPEPAPQYTGVDMGKDVTPAQAEPIGPDLPDEFKVEF